MNYLFEKIAFTAINQKFPLAPHICRSNTYYGTYIILYVIFSIKLISAFIERKNAVAMKIARFDNERSTVDSDKSSYVVIAFCCVIRIGNKKQQWGLKPL